MVDADESMVKKFEAAFFPKQTKDETIASHLAAASQADNDNNPQLAKVHRDYAAALTDGREELENDAVGAAAALAKKDYATFIAKGVRFSESNTSRTDNFRRTIDASISTSETIAWDQAQTITRLRESSMPVYIESEVVMKPTLGPVTGATYTVPWFRNHIYPVQRSGLMVGHVAAGGPLSSAGIEPGMLLFRVAGQPVKTLADLQVAIAALSPGQQIDVERFESSGGVFPSPYGPQVQNGTSVTTTVIVGRRPTQRSQ